MPIDILENPSLNKEPQSNDRPSLLARALQSGARGSVFLPDMASNAGKRIGEILANSLNWNANPETYNQRVDDKFGKTIGSLMHLDVPQNNPSERSLINNGIVNQNMPEAKTYGEKVADYAGAGLGSLLPFLPLKGGASSLFGSVPKAASTLGMVAAPAAIAPKVDEMSDHNPLVNIPTQILASILGGKIGGGIAKPFSSPEPLPEYTASQKSYMENPDSPSTKSLIARQLDLAKKDPKSADILDQIGKNQEADIVKNMTPDNPISGEDVAQNIENNTKDLMAKRSSDYQAADAQLMSNPQKVDVTPTLNLIQQLRSRAATGGDLDKALNQAEALISSNADNPQAVMNAKTSLQKLANYSPDLRLDGQESAAIKKVASQFGQDIDQAMPGYSDMNKTYSDQTKQLQGIIDGLGGKVVAAGETAPSSIPRRIFEKVDPALSGQLQAVLPPDIYGQAANSYLGDVLQRSQSSPTKNVYNNGSQMYKMGDILSRNYPTLQQTLPPEQLAKVDQTLKDIDVSMLGRPRNDYTIDARRGYAVGDEIKGKGLSALDGSWSNPLNWIPKVANAATTPLRRNEMLTGQSPTSQIIGGIVPQSMAVNAMNQPPLPPTNQGQVAPQIQQPQEMQQPYQQRPSEFSTIPDSWKQKIQSQMQQPTSFADFDQKYGLNANKALSPTDQPKSFAEFDQKYALNGAVPNQQNPNDSNNQSSVPQQKEAAPLTQDILDFIGKRLKSGDTNVLYDPSGEYQKFKTSMSPDSPAFIDKVKKIVASRESSGDYSAMSPNSSAIGKYQFIDGTRNSVMPDVSREDFLNNPDLQEQAMNKLIMANEQTFKNKGVDPSSVSPDNLAGMLMAAHLRGPQAGINAYQNASYQGEPDANGTLPRNYYDYAKNSFNSGKFDATPDFKSMNSDDLLNYGQNILKNMPQPSNDSMQT